MGVIFTAMLVMAFTMLSAFSSVGFSRQRTEATSLADQALEQIRALPGDALFLSAADAASDTQLVPAGCLATLNCTFNNRTVPVANFGSSPAATAPLVPSHVSTVVASPGSTTYTIKAYVTLDPGDPTNQTRIATVQVSWNKAQKSGLAASVQVESKLHTAPFSESAPGTHTYNATAYDVPGSVTIIGTLLNRTGVNEAFNLQTANAYLTGGTAGTTVGGVQAGQQVSGGSAGLGLQALGIPLVSAPGATATAISPAGSATPDGPHQAVGSPGGVLQITGSAGVGLGLINGTLNGQVTAGPETDGWAVAASKANGQASIPSGQTLPTNKLGYGRATSTQTGLISANLNLISLLNVPLLSATPTGNTTPDMATVAESASGPTTKYTASADKYLTQLDVMPSGLGLLSPVVHLVGFHAAAAACAAGPGGTCPASTASMTGTLQILGGPSINLQGHVAGALGLQTTTVAVGLATVVIGANVSIGSVSAASPGSASVTSPLTIDVRIQVSTLLLGQIVDLTVHVDLGSVTTTANYS